MVLTKHKKFYVEILDTVPGMVEDKRVMTFGFQDISPDFGIDIPYPAKSFKDWLIFEGADEVVTIDYKDPRADIKLDMNLTHLPWSDNHFDTVIDIGCLEHVFNFGQAMCNCMASVKLNGHYMLHTPVRGYYQHGFHTFDPDMLRWVLSNNGFEIVYDQYSTKSGTPLDEPIGDTLIWLVARKVEPMSSFFFKIPVNFKGQEVEESIHVVKPVDVKEAGASLKEVQEIKRDHNEGGVMFENSAADHSVGFKNTDESEPFVVGKTYKIKNHDSDSSTK